MDSEPAISHLYAEFESSVATDNRAGGIGSVGGTQHGNDTSSLVFVCLYRRISNRR